MNLFSDLVLKNMPRSMDPKDAYLQKGNIYISCCSSEISWICEKIAASIKTEDLD